MGQNIVAVEGDVLPAERRDVGKQIIADNLTLLDPCADKARRARSTFTSTTMFRIHTSCHDRLMNHWAARRPCANNRNPNRTFL